MFSYLRCITSGSREFSKGLGFPQGGYHIGWNGEWQGYFPLAREGQEPKVQRNGSTDYSHALPTNGPAGPEKNTGSRPEKKGIGSAGS